MTISEILSIVTGEEGKESSLRKILMTEAAILYLDLIKMIKKVFVSIVIMLTALFIVCGGLSFLIISLALKAQDNLLPVAAVWIFLVIVPVLMALTIFSDKFWMKVFRADEFIERIENAGSE